MTRTTAIAAAFVAALGLSVVAAGATRELSGRITADGSSTVGPYAQAAAEMFMNKHRKVQITVGISGTGGGFERFSRGEIDLSERIAADQVERARDVPVEQRPLGRVHRRER